MGFVYDAHGKVTIEGRLESFIIHTERSREHPEFDHDELDDLIEALTAYREEVCK